MGIRNVLFDLGWLPSYKPKVVTIAIGNLNTGGTGKTPFTELLIKMLQEKHKIAVVSRGYGRKSNGFLWVEPTSDAVDVGDEPLQIKQKYPLVKVAVCEKRVDAIKKIESEFPEIDLILMDDAFQHRHVRAKINILLSTYQDPYYNDCVLPTGNLRERRKGMKRADFIVITKCPSDLTSEKSKAIKSKIKPKAYQNVFFSQEKYGVIYDLISLDVADIKAESAFLVSGIANNSSLSDHISSQFEKVETLKLSDHVVYDLPLISRIIEKYKSLDSQLFTCVITTEKDAVKIRVFNKELSDIPFYVLPFEHSLLDWEIFADQIEDKIMT